MRKRKNGKNLVEKIKTYQSRIRNENLNLLHRVRFGLAVNAPPFLFQQYFKRLPTDMS